MHSTSCDISELVLMVELVACTAALCILLSVNLKMSDYFAIHTHTELQLSGAEVSPDRW